MLIRILNGAVLRMVGGVTAALVLSAGASAESQPRQVRVAYADLNLTSEAGAATILARLDSAAKRVCDSGAIGNLIAVRIDASQCRTRAVEGGLAQLVASVPVHDRLREPLRLSRH